MIYQTLKDLFYSSVDYVVPKTSQYSVNPDTDFMRNRKIAPQKLISFLVSQGSSSTKVEMLDFWGMDSSMPSSALNQQRSKLNADALEAVFKHFNLSVTELPSGTLTDDNYRFLAADGSTCTFLVILLFQLMITTAHRESLSEWVYSMHLNAFFNLASHTYTDALIKPVHCKNEFGASCDIVDRHDILNGRKNVYIGDRGYCSYNNMVHVLEQGQYFLFRTKDIHSKGLVANFDFPEEESFDVDVKVTLVGCHSRKVSTNPETYKRFIDQASSFDYIDYGSYGTYELTFRIIRFPISESTYECIVTNLPRDEFPAERIKKLYFSRWNIMPISALYPSVSHRYGLFHFYQD